MKTLLWFLVGLIAAVPAMAAQPGYQRNVLTTNDPPLVAFVLTPQASTNGLPNALRLTNASGTLTTNAQGYLIITTTGGSATNAQPPSDNLTNWSTVGTNQVLFIDASNSILTVVTNAITDATNKVLVTVTNAITDATNKVLVTVTNAITQATNDVLVVVTNSITQATNDVLVVVTNSITQATNDVLVVVTNAINASATTNASTNWTITYFITKTNGYGTNTILDAPINTNASFFGPALSYASSASNAPADNEFVTGLWVRGLFSGGTFLYNITNVHPVNPTNYIASVTTNSTAQVRLYTNTGAGNYLGGGIMSTQRYTTVYSPMTVNAYLSLSGVGGPATTLHPEFYYTYDGTNLLGDYECGAQALVNGSTNLRSFVISFPTIQSTNSTGFFVVRRFKVDTQSGVEAVVGVHGSGSTPSHIAFANPPTADASLGVRGALAMIVTNAPAITNATYDTNNRTFIVSGPPVMPLLSQADGTVGSAILNLQSDAQLSFTNAVNTTTIIYITNPIPGHWFTVRFPAGSNKVEVLTVGPTMTWLTTNYCQDGSLTNISLTNKVLRLSGRVFNLSGATNIDLHAWQQP